MDKREVQDQLYQLFCAGAATGGRRWRDSTTKCASRVRSRIPNVCRIYDLAEADGETFLSMEYVDGEDLSSLLRRIGRLPADKAIQSARQLCAGLAAAHDLGVLHRDLKPSNVMLDGRGAVKITDFGLADFIERVSSRELAGTPAYMAPELLAGAVATIKSDLYALGLVLFEMFTGAPAFGPGNAAGRAQTPRAAAPPTPSGTQPDIDPIVERVIIRCLDSNPALRPLSARAVAAGLPGGDPLAAALAAGETPSPEMVADAGSVGSLRPGVAWGCFAAIVAGIVFIAATNDRVGLLRQVSLRLSPDVLTARATEVLRRGGYLDEPVDSVRGFEYDNDFVASLRSNGSPERWRQVSDARPSLIRFWYRESDRWIVPWTITQFPTPIDPPQTEAGALVVLDPRGRLQRLTIIPRPAADSAAVSPVPDWDAMFSEAGLSRSDFTVTSSTRVPPVYADLRAAWSETSPKNAALPMRIEAASHNGRPVYFEIVGPYPRSSLFEIWPRAGLILLVVVILSLMVAAALIARRNIRLGRSDQRAAFRLALFTLALGVPAYLLGTHHVIAIDEVLQLLKTAMKILTLGAVFWLAYIALEPLVRRRWPDLIVSSTRLLSGRLRDPLIGRDVLIGGLSGVIANVMGSAYLLTAVTLDWPRRPLPFHYLFGPLANPSEAFSMLAWIISIAVQDALGVMLLLVVLTIVLRRRWLAITAFFLVIVGLLATDLGFPLWLVAVQAGLVSLVVVRWGLLAMMANTIFVLSLQWLPITLDLRAFYFAASIIPIAFLLTLGWYGVYTSLGGRPLAGWTESEAA